MVVAVVAVVVLMVQVVVLLLSVQHPRRRLLVVQVVWLRPMLMPTAVQVVRSSGGGRGDRTTADCCGSGYGANR